MTQGEYDRIQVVKDGVQDTAEWISYKDIQMYTREYKPIEQEVVAAMVIHHGFGEHCDRYEDISMYLAKNGILVLTFDQRGWGKTGRRNGGKLGNMGTFSGVHETIKFMLDRVKIPGKPLFLVTLSYCDSTPYAKELTGVIVSAPALMVNPKVKPPAIVVGLLKGFASVFPNIPFQNKLDTKLLTSDEVVRKAYEDSPYNYDFTTIGVLAELLKRGDECSNVGAKKFSVPVLVLQASGDQICIEQGAQKFYSNLPNDLDKKMEIFDCNYHEIHFEKEFKGKFFSCCADWIKARL
ncbi:putative monoglyceride lipase [Zancudomyces culisetae]|uniref:Putative monoglyceride lipase n=1 Tax=Zancudomyces culisetae TaxID=1213189 RepID=A0A1R1PVX4_ZANCU|nr:putative monoglyceride lipase [Zancudomyces culisetae]|eukprot:OMH85117.1 putative monoglyceride lipase [Zancudomyces culisetae]